MNSQTSVMPGMAELHSTRTAAVVAPPGTPPPLARLVGAPYGAWVDVASLDAWLDRPGDRALLLAGDTRLHPESLDVAVVLPELRRSLDASFDVGVARPHDEAAIAQRFGARRWPTVVFLREDRYLGAIGGMQDWEVFCQRTTEILASEPSLPPTIDIPVVAAGARRAL